MTWRITMKSLPEKEIFNQLESRLRRYTEMPDDDAWDKIAGALPKEEGMSGWVWFDRLSAVAIIGLLLLLVVMNQPGGVANGSNSRSIPAADESTSTNKNKSSSVSDNNLENSNSSLYEKNQEAPSVDLPDDDRTTSKVAVVNKRMLSENERSISHNSDNQKPISSKSLQSKVQTSASDKSKDRNHPQDVGDDKLSGSNNNIAISMNNTISMTEDHPSSDLSNASLNSHQEPDGKLKDNISNDYSSVSDAETSVDSVHKSLMKTKDSLEIERKKRVPKELRKEKKIFKSVLYFTATPTLAYYKLTPDMHDDVTVVGLKQTGIFNTNRLGFNLEAGYQRKLNEKLEVYGGLSYYQQSQQIKYYYESAEGSNINIAPSNDFTFTVDPVAQKRERHIDYAMKNVGVSAGLFYLIKDGRLQHKIGGGLQYQKGLARQNADAAYSNASSSYFNYLIAYRLEWRYKTRTNFFIQPNVNHVIHSKENLTAPFSVKPYRAGIGFGILYWF